ncbi:MAG: glutathione S-transferase family protein [Cyanobacteria bacterium P01_A01_bin.135]
MLTFYYNPVSVNARRVWITLLEKQLDFDPVLVNLDGDQFSDDFTALSPLQRVPVLVDNGVRIVESLAILAYLDAQYPAPPLMPTAPEAIALVHMVGTITVVELQPETIPLTRAMLGLAVDPAQRDRAQRRIDRILAFLETLLRQPYIAGEAFTLADIVAGSLLPALPLDPYPRLSAWAEQLNQRPSWQQTAPTPEAIAAATPNIRAILDRRAGGSIGSEMGT